MNPFSLGPHIGHNPQREHFCVTYIHQQVCIQKALWAQCETHWSILCYFACIMLDLSPNMSLNASRWNMVAMGNIRVGFELVMSVSCCLLPFLPVLLPNTNAFSGGIFAKQYKLLVAGIGVGMVVVSFLVAIYYNMIIAWAIFYLFSSFTSTLPWKDCGPWATECKYMSLYLQVR